MLKTSQILSECMCVQCSRSNGGQLHCRDIKTSCESAPVKGPNDVFIKCVSLRSVYVQGFALPRRRKRLKSPGLWQALLGDEVEEEEEEEAEGAGGEAEQTEQQDGGSSAVTGQRDGGSGVTTGQQGGGSGAGPEGDTHNCV